MLKRLDKIRFRGQKRDEFLDLAESPNASDSECNDDIPPPMMRPRHSIKETEEPRDPAGQGSLSMAIQDFQRTDSERLNEVKGHLEIALLEKHFLREYLRQPPSLFLSPEVVWLAVRGYCGSWCRPDKLNCVAQRSQRYKGILGHFYETLQ